MRVGFVTTRAISNRDRRNVMRLTLAPRYASEYVSVVPLNDSRDCPQSVGNPLGGFPH